MQELEISEINQVAGGSFLDFVNKVWASTPVGYVVNLAVTSLNAIEPKRDPDRDRWNKLVDDTIAHNPDAYVDRFGALRIPEKHNQ